MYNVVEYRKLINKIVVLFKYLYKKHKLNHIKYLLKIKNKYDVNKLNLNQILLILYIKI